MESPLLQYSLKIIVSIHDFTFLMKQDLNVPIFQRANAALIKHNQFELCAIRKTNPERSKITPKADIFTLAQLPTSLCMIVL